MMITRLVVRLAVMFCVGLASVPAFAANVFFSTLGTVGGGVTLDDPVVTHTLADGAGSLYIWSTADEDYRFTIGMNVVSSTTGTISFSGGEVFNPDIVSDYFGGVPVDVRWEGTVGGEVYPDRVRRMNAVSTFIGTGIITANDGTVAPFLLRDELYDVSAGAILLAVVHYDIVGLGTTTLTIDQEDTALFVDVDETKTAVQVFPDFGIATIQVVPEPSSFFLVTLGLLVSLFHPWRREEHATLLSLSDNKTPLSEKTVQGHCRLRN